MSQQITLTGSYSDGSFADVTALATFVSDDSSISAVSSPGGLVTYGAGAKIYGGQCGVTATIGSVVTATLVRVVAADSGSQRMPLSDRQWTDLGLSPWGAYGGCQESTGSLVLSGSAGYTLTPVNVATFPGVAYSQTVTGGSWSRVGVAMSGVTSQRIAAAAGVGPNPSTDSVAILAYCMVGPSTVGSQIIGIGAAAGGSRLLMAADSTFGSTGQVEFSFNGLPKKLTGPLTMRHTDRVHPYLLVYNRTTAEVWGFTDQCIVFSGSSNAQVDGTKMFGSNNAVGMSGTMVYWATCTGSVAESFASVDGGANLLNTLGWNVAYRGCPADSGTIRSPFTPTCWKSLGLSPWSAAHNLQEVTGTIVSFDSWAGTNLLGWGLSVVLNVTYRNVQAGWTRRSIDVAEVTSARVSTASTVIGSYTGSAAFLGYAKLGTAAGANRSLLGGYNTALGARFRVQYGAAGIPQLNCSGTVTTAVNDHRDGRFHPFLIVYDATNSRAKMYTDLEAHTGTFGVLNQAPSIGLGAIVAGEVAAPASHLYFAACTGSTAEALSDDGRASAFLKTLGWTVPW